VRSTIEFANGGLELMLSAALQFIVSSSPNPHHQHHSPDMR